MKKYYIFTFLILVFISPVFSTVHTVVNVGFTFSPAELTIDFGDSVNFTIGGAHQVREVSETDWDANSSTALSGGFETALGGGMLLPASLPVGTHFYVCIPHAGMGMKGKIIVNPSSLSIEKTEARTTFSVSPNPSSGLFTIQLSSNAAVISGQAEVFNLLGERVLQLELNGTQTNVDLSSFDRGIYFVKLKMGEAVLTQKLVLR